MSIHCIGVVVTRNTLMFTDALNNYSYLNVRDSPSRGIPLARCLTGLGPSGTSNGVNGLLGGWYFYGRMIPNSGEQASCSPCSSDIMQVRPEATTAGVTNLRQCGPFSTSVEGIYTCTMMNSSMMDQSFRLGVYFTGRSKSLNIVFTLSRYIPDHKAFDAKSLQGIEVP